MERFKHDILGISEIRWIGEGETPDRHFIQSGEHKTHVTGIDMLLSDSFFCAIIFGHVFIDKFSNLKIIGI